MKRVNQFERTNRDITNALLTLMEYKDIEKISVQDILNEALVNRSTFYQHFTDKYAVLERLQDRFIAGMTERIDELGRSGTWDMDKINGVFFEYLSQNRGQIRKILSVRSKNLDLAGRMRALFADYLSKTGSKLNVMETKILAGVMVGFFEELLNGEIDEREFSTRMLDTWLDMTVFFFRVEDITNAKKYILELIGQMRREKKE